MSTETTTPVDKEFVEILRRILDLGTSSTGRIER